MSPENSNPYASPAAPNTDGVVDRAGRAALADAIRQFLDEQTSAFAFDETVHEFGTSADPTIRFVAQAVWYHYDDCVDHFVALSKHEWDYFQRLLLLLASDRQIASTYVRRWSWTQLVALGCLLGFGWCVRQFGWGEHLSVFAIPFGIVSILISLLRNRRRSIGAYDSVLTPFSTFAELDAAYRSAAPFAKKRYPSVLTDRRIRSPVGECRVRLQMYAGWLLLSPIPLLVQTFPWTETRTHVTSALRPHAMTPQADGAHRSAS